jgi:hypothetical protein
MTQKWITDRQPTKEDENDWGKVCMLRFPDGRKSYLGFPDAMVAAAHVGPGVPWRHAVGQEPPATPELEPEASKPTPKPKLRVGQVWRIRTGALMTVKMVDGDRFLVTDEQGFDWGYRPDGSAIAVFPGRDLVELVTDAPAESPQPEPEPTTRKVPRLFAEPPRRTFSPSGAPQWDALADDGTAWKWSGTLEEWDQHQPLPDREVPIDA